MLPMLVQQLIAEIYQSAAYKSAGKLVLAGFTVDSRKQWSKWLASYPGWYRPKGTLAESRWVWLSCRALTVARTIFNVHRCCLPEKYVHLKDYERAKSGFDASMNYAALKRKARITQKDLVIERNGHSA